MPVKLRCSCPRGGANLDAFVEPVTYLEYEAVELTRKPAKSKVSLLVVNQGSKKVVLEEGTLLDVGTGPGGDNKDLPQHLEDMVYSSSDLDQEQLQHVAELVSEFSDMFVGSDGSNISCKTSSDEYR